jgi:hypothetical protein
MQGNRTHRSNKRKEIHMSNKQRRQHTPIQPDASKVAINVLDEECLEFATGGANSYTTIDISKLPKVTVEQVKRTAKRDNARMQARAEAIKNNKPFIGF